MTVRVSTCLYMSLLVSTCLYMSLLVSTCLYLSLLCLPVPSVPSLLDGAASADAAQVSWPEIRTQSCPHSSRYTC